MINSLTEFLILIFCRHDEEVGVASWDVSDYLSVSRENEVILGRSVFFMTNSFFCIVFFVFQGSFKYYCYH